MRAPILPLFVPGDRPERFAKAADSGADAVILDLEDAVAAKDKPRARAAVAAHGLSDVPVILRVNDPRGAEGQADLEVLAEVRPDAVMVPMAETPAMLEAVRAHLPGVSLIPLIETAAGIENAGALCRVAGVLCPAFGSLDLARDLGISPSHPVVMDHARVRLVLAARAAGVAPPLDGVCPDLRDAARIEREARAARNLGLGGKMAIHPAQLLPIREGFRPNSEELAWAQRILEAADGGAGAMQLDGQMIDAPVLSRARAVLARGESTFG